MAAGISQTAAYKAVKGTPEGKQEVHKELSEGLQVLIHNDVDAIFCEVRRTQEVENDITNNNSLVFPQHRGDGVGHRAGTEPWQASSCHYVHGTYR